MGGGGEGNRRHPPSSPSFPNKQESTQPRQLNVPCHACVVSCSSGGVDCEKASLSTSPPCLHLLQATAAAKPPLHSSSPHVLLISHFPYNPHTHAHAHDLLYYDNSPAGSGMFWLLGGENEWRERLGGRVVMTNGGLSGTHELILLPSLPPCAHTQVTAAAFVRQVRPGDAWEGGGRGRLWEGKRSCPSP